MEVCASTAFETIGRPTSETRRSGKAGQQYAGNDIRRALLELRADVFDVVAKFAMGESVDGETVDDPERRAEIADIARRSEPLPLVEASAADAGRTRRAWPGTHTRIHLVASDWIIVDTGRYPLLQVLGPALHRGALIASVHLVVQSRAGRRGRERRSLKLRQAHDRDHRRATIEKGDD